MFDAIVSNLPPRSGDRTTQGHTNGRDGTCRHGRYSVYCMSAKSREYCLSAICWSWALTPGEPPFAPTPTDLYLLPQALSTVCPPY